MLKAIQTISYIKAHALNFPRNSLSESEVQAH